MNSEKKLTVAIVEDEPLISIFIKRIVSSMGENIVAVCYDSDVALKELQEQKPNLIFMDINIKGPLDGISVIRKLSMLHNPTIFFVSAYSDSETIEDALSTNPYNYLIKPIKEEDIQIAVSLARKEQFKAQSLSPQKQLIFSDEIYYDYSLGELKFPTSILLTAIEIKVINLFIHQINSNISLENLQENIWTDKDISDSTIRDVISKIRKKIPQIKIETNFGRGYILQN